MVLLFCVLVIGCLSLFPNSALSDEIQVERIELLNGSYVEGFYNISLFEAIKYNRTTYVLNLELELFVDEGQDQDQDKLEASFFYNRMNNNQYSRTPMRIPKSPICGVFRGASEIMTKDSIEKYTNFPVLNGCPIKKV